MTDDEEIFIRCTRCADLPSPLPISTKVVDCYKCKRKIWVSPETLDAAVRKYPGHPVKTVCMACGVPGDHEIGFLPEQVEILRAAGDSDQVIAYKFAIAEVAGGSASLEEAEAEILACPNGDRALAFPRAYRRARRLVAGTRAPTN